MSKRTKLNQENGFTILELMIATVILATILLIVASVMINISDLFYKGTSQAHVQDDTRSIIDEVSQDIELNSVAPQTNSGASNSLSVNGTAETVYSVCIGSVRYSYVTGLRLGASGTTEKETNGTTTLPLSPNILWRDNSDFYNSSYMASSPTGTSCIPVDVGSPGLANADPNGTELISDNSRLLYFCITSAGSSGNNACRDLSASPYEISVGVSYGAIDLLTNQSSVLDNNPNSSSALCSGNAGDQFCSTSNISTTVTQTLTGGS